MEENSDMTKIHFDYNDIEGKNFECQRCGTCCYYQLVHISSVRINKILDYINNISNTKIKKFLRDVYPRTGKKIGMENARKDLKNFYVPFSFITNKDCKIVTMYIIWKTHPSKRCIFFNPIENSCLLYDVRPSICEQYPVCPTNYEGKMGLDNGCIGIGHGIKIDIEKMKILQRTDLEETLNDDEIIRKFLKDRKIEIIENDINEKNERNLKKNAENIIKSWYGNKNANTYRESEKLITIQPLIELGIIPHNIWTKAAEKI